MREQGDDFRYATSVRHWLRRTAALAAVCLSTGTAAAQSSTPDFLFGAPRGAVSFRGGYRILSGSSSENSVFDFFSETLTLEQSQFNGGVFGLDVALAVHPRVDVLAGFEYSSPKASSEYRDLEEENGDPITQQTELTTMPFTGSVKFYLTPRGRSISRFAYVPSKYRPYVGAGGGLVWSKLQQGGDFVDFVDLAIFSAVFQSTGFSTQLHAFGGVDIQLATRVYLSIEARYVWADVELSGDFVGFDPIDLSALQTTVGVSISF